MGRNVTYTLNLNSNLNAILAQNEAAAVRMDNTMWQLQKTLSSFGVGLGAHFLIDAAKNWTQAAADYEQAMLRIRNASKDGFGTSNEFFLNEQVDKFKIKLQEGADAYGKFLFFVKNAPYSNEVENKLFQNLNIVGKVGGISQENMDATINNVSKLLTEGVLEGRTLRNLSRVHPGVVPFLATELGLKDRAKDEFSSIFSNNIDDETATQKFSQMISSGKLTKLGLSPDALIRAIQDYADSLSSKLPETLHTLNSELNDLSNTWLRFKNSAVLDNKPELVGFFNELKNGIGWLVDHEEGIIRTGKAILDIAEAYAIWRVSLFAMQVPFGILKMFSSEQERLNDVLALYSVKVEETKVANTVLLESNLKLQQTDIEENIILKEKTEALDLFTNAQLTNIAATEKLIEVENGLLWNEASAFRGFGYGQGNATSSGVNKYITVTESEALALEAESLAMRGNLGLEEALTAQALLFSDAQMRASESTGVLTSEMLLLNEQMSNNAILLSTNSIKAGATSGISGAFGGSSLFGSGVGILSAAAVPVMITWIAGSVLDAMFPPSDKESKWVDGKSVGFFHPINSLIAEHRAAVDYNYMRDAGYVDLNDDLYNPNWIRKEDVQKQHNSEYGYSVWDGLYNPNDVNSQLMNKYGVGLGKKAVNSLAKDTEHIRGNSSNYVTVNIHEMNGMKNPVFKEVNNQTMINVEEEVGTALVKILTGVVNDSQLVGKHH